MSDLNYLKYKLIGLLGSRKFWVMGFAAALSLGLDIPEELQAGIVLIAMGIFATNTAWEDNKAREWEAQQEMHKVAVGGE